MAFNRIYRVFVKVKTIPGTYIRHNWEMLTCVSLKYIMDCPMLNAFISVGKSIRRVNKEPLWCSG